VKVIAVHGLQPLFPSATLVLPIDNAGVPDEITRETAEPAAADVPAAGVWLITEPAGTTVLACVVVAPSENPAPVMAEVALACVSPTTFGTAVEAVDPEETTRATAELMATTLPAAGF
jgi:hypothetical protein